MEEALIKIIHRVNNEQGLLFVNRIFMPDAAHLKIDKESLLIKDKYNVSIALLRIENINQIKLVNDYLIIKWEKGKIE